MSGGHIETLGMLMIELEGVVDRVTIIHPFQGETGVGVLALEPENHTELIQSHRNVVEKVHHVGQLVLIRDHLVIVEAIGHLQEVVMSTS